MRDPCDRGSNTTVPSRAAGRIALVAALLVAVVAAPDASLAATLQRVPYPSATVQPAPLGLDAATRRAAELQEQLTALRIESALLEARMKSTTEAIYRQSVALEHARSEEASARARFDDRVVGMYKSGLATPLEIVLTAPTFADALDRGVFLLTIAERDEHMLDEARKLSSQAAYEAQRLDTIRSQDVQLREAHDNQLRVMEGALAEQERLVRTLGEAQKRYLAQRAAWDAQTRRQWQNSGFSGDVVKVAASVIDYPGVTYLVDEGEPTLYRAVDLPKTMVCSWYGNADNRPTPTSSASGRAFNEHEFTCASRTLPFGTRLACTYCTARVIVVVTDRGPYIDGRDLDLSKSAADALGFNGVERVSVQTVVPTE
jgi:rare lipoprotein A